jgi:hypothetical protein
MQGKSDEAIHNSKRATFVKRYHVVFPSQNMVTIFSDLGVPHYHATASIMTKLMNERQNVTQVKIYTSKVNATPFEELAKDDSFLTIYRDMLGQTNNPASVAATFCSEKWVAKLAKNVKKYGTTDESRGQFGHIDFGFSTTNCPRRERRLYGITGPSPLVGFKNKKKDKMLVDAMVALSELYLQSASPTVMKTR